MMRWLKDKKKEKRTNSSSGPEDADKEEDDYGFEKVEKEKFGASKSPSTKRQLPPTPADPEEKSPHIYEEINDLPGGCPSGAENVPSKKSQKCKSSGKSATPNTYTFTTSPGHASAKASEGKGDSGPYMVVPVDKDVRQTPPNFHRDGTPEVHCDVIVKDTHCEILMTRKPKVGAFRVGASVNPPAKDANVNAAMKNNTHFCSRDRRASAAHIQGRSSSAFSLTSSAFTSSSTSRVNSVGASSISLSNISEQHQLSVTCEESESNSSRGQGVQTYTAASNFIPRATKLEFRPLEVTGYEDEGTVESMNGPTCFSYSQEPDTNGNYAQMVSNKRPESEGVVYSPVQEKPVGENGSICYASIEEPGITSPNPHAKMSYQFQSPPSTSCFYKTEGSDFHEKGDIQSHIIGNNNFDLMRVRSPSISSSCTYASINLPHETKLYDTITDPIPDDANRQNGVTQSLRHDFDSVNLPHGGSSDDLSVLYADIKSGPVLDDTSSTYTPSYPPPPYPKNQNAAVSSNMFPGSYALDRDVDNSHKRSAQFHRDNVYHQRFGGKYSHEVASGSGFVNPAGSNHQENVHLNFCTCSDDQHSALCGFSNGKQDDDDLNSMLGATGGADDDVFSPSCKGCGRLIRQITYSESFSDETYEHAYSSRLLIRRRFSSPDLTWSETASECQEFQDLNASKTRDDTWASSRGYEVMKNPHGSMYIGGDDNQPGLLSKAELNSSSRTESSLAMAPGPLSKLLKRNTSPVSSESSSLSGPTLAGPSFRRINLSSHSSVLKKSDQIPLLCGETDQAEKTATSPPVSQMSPNIIPRKPTSAQGLYRSGFTNAKQVNSEPTNVLYDSINTDDITRATIKRPGQSTTDCKSSVLAGILSRLYRGKSKISKADVNSNKDCLSTSDSDHLSTQLKTSFTNDNVGIPNQNTRKLSQLFQSLADKDIDDVLCQNTHDANDDITSSAFLASTFRSNNSESSSELFGSVPSHLITNAFQSDEIASGAQSVATDNNCNQIRKTGNKTDSGDTCYEYDISTSSESEQTSYDYFLSKIKKTLNLEGELQHISESNRARKKMLCKRCRRDGASPNAEDTVCSDGHRSRLMSKLGDLKDIFGDMVVDQRTAILDCLTDLVHNPYNIKCQGHHDTHCRECGGDVVTSDSESLTTVYSMMSQQASQHTPSCDSDEGTMADNSGESGDEADNKDSSGYDEPGYDVLEHTSSSSHKSKKREKLKKKTKFNGSGQNVSCKDSQNHNQTAETYNAVKSKVRASNPKDTELNDKTKASSKVRKSSTKSAGLEKKEDAAANDLDESRSSLVSSRGNREEDPSPCLKSARFSNNNLASDKAIQDIYAPLPNRALSLITNAAYGSHSSNTCICPRHSDGTSASNTYIQKGHGNSTFLYTGRQHRHNGEAKMNMPCLDDFQNCNSQMETDKTMVPETNSRAIRNETSREETDNNSKPFMQFTEQSTVQNMLNIKIQKSPKHPRVHSRRYKEEMPLKNVPESSPNNHGLQDKCDKAMACLPVPESTQKISASPQQYRRRHKLNLDTLDLLPETIFGVDSEETPASVDTTTDTSTIDENVGNTSTSEIPNDFIADEVSCKHRHSNEGPNRSIESGNEGVKTSSPAASKSHAVRQSQSSNVEKMKKLFENQANSKIESSRQEDKNSTGIKPMASPALKRQSNELKSSTSPALKRQSTELKSILRPPKEKMKEADYKSKSQRQKESILKCSNESTKTYAQKGYDIKADAKGQSFVETENPRLSGEIDNKYRSRSRRAKERALSSRDSAKYSDDYALKEKSEKSSRSKFSTDVRYSKRQSPTPSTSSSSSSSSSSKRRSHSRYRKNGKKYYSHRKRSKSRNGRSKSLGAIGTRERTVYYLSSDLSDIDVVEVADWETYAQSFTPKVKGQGHSKQARSKSIKKSDGVSGASNDNSVLSGVTSQDDSKEGDLTQEIYAIPGGSAELRKTRAEGDNSTSAASSSAAVATSADASKSRKNKRTDVYKTRKNNNKLLSDMIIRNYDMQVFGNV